MKALVWFRSDLRTADNPALHRAAEQADEGVIAVFVPCPGQWREHDWGDVKVEFLRRSLEALGERLAALGVPLLVPAADRFDDLPDLLADLAERHSCDALYFNRELEVNEDRRDRAVAARFEDDGRRVEACHDQTVVEPGAIKTKAGDFYSVYTPFRKSWMELVRERGMGDPLPEPAAREADAGASSDPVPETFDGFSSAPEAAEHWPAGEDEAHRRLERFLEERAHDYADRRDLAAADGTSELSPYLALGVISSRACLAAAVAANEGELESGDPGLDTWIQELVWREFYRHVLVGFPRVSKNRAFREETDEEVAWRYDEDDFEAWRQGRTGYPFVDAGMRQLAATGWMHNRLRMVTAMFLTKHLLVDWRWGERHFMRRLVDGDLASNNGGWQWSASTGTDAAPYFRIFNPWTQGQRYDADGEYTRRWVPELAEADAAALHDPAKLARLDRHGLGYPEPIVEHRKARRRALDAFGE